MASSHQRRADSQLEHVSEQEAVAVPANARPTDESPTVISKTPPIVPSPSTQDKIADLARKSTPESIVAGLRGRQLAHFELIEPIGVGGMAAVIRARDTQLDRFVALKILPPETAHEPENVQRFHQEAKAAAKLDHENIARVFFCGEDQGLHFIAFEYVEGVNLRTMMEQRGRLPVAEAVRYILQVATGLEHAATRGVVHRDVKPSNIIITPTGRAKLVDMGLARNMERRGETELTQSGMTLGTFDYISPEQALEPREADVRSDIYSLGCTFYHLLTGQPPVPEGTPAKKLHHHQHMSPVDPRQVDPGIPDEIVMILDKMMRKNPHDRYQRPIHLVHHLVQVAKKVGAADDLPEGVLFVDTPLPGQPHNRPLLFIGLALAALVGVISVLSLLEPVAKQVNKAGESKSPDVADVKGKGNGGAPPGNASAGPEKIPAVVQSAADLKTVLDHPGAAAQAAIADIINLKNTGATYHGSADQVIKLESEEAEHATIRFQYDSSGAPVGLSVEGGKEIVFKRIRFEIECENTPDRVAAAVAVRGARVVRFEQCVFAQPKAPKLTPAPKRERVPIASVLIEAENALDPAPIVYITDCCFEGNTQNGPAGPSSGGQVGIAINGPATVHVSNTAFRPHSAFFSFRDKCTLENTVLHFTSCTGLVAKGPAFRFSHDASAKIFAQDSVFSRPDQQPSDVGQPGLIYLSGEKYPILYEGRHNLYHALNDFVERKGGFILKLDDFKSFLGPKQGFDLNSIYIERADAAANPLANATAPAGADEMAFQLKAEYAKDFGIQKSWLGRPMPKADAPLVKNVTPKKKIVDGDDLRRMPGEFANVAEALSRAKDGDVIYIKHGEDSRLVEVPPVGLKPGVSVTLKPYEGHQPILVLDKAFREKDSTLFRLQDGKLQFEQLAFLLDPLTTGFESQSVVHLGEAAHCVFKQCIVSLKTQTEINLNVVTFVDLNLMMKMDSPAPPAARVEFHDCFVRGKGDLVALRGCRLLYVEIKNSLVALDGSLLDIDAKEKMMAMTQGVRWKMERSSVFTTDSIFALRSKTGGIGLTKTLADIEGCLFVSLKAERPVVLLDMMKNSNLDTYLEWKGDQNFYANFDKDKVREWKDLFAESKADFGKIGLPKLNDENMQTLWDAELDWFKPGDAAELERISGFGIPADTEKKLQQLLNSDDP